MDKFVSKVLLILCLTIAASFQSYAFNVRPMEKIVKNVSKAGSKEKTAARLIEKSEESSSRAANGAGIANAGKKLFSMKCKRCNGKGYIYGVRCSSCNGMGSIPIWKNTTFVMVCFLVCGIGIGYFWSKKA